MHSPREQLMGKLDVSLRIARPSKHRRHFTIAQADRSLVLLRRIVADIILGYQVLFDLQEVLEAAEARGRTVQIHACRAKLQSAVDKLQHCLDELSDMGVEIRDWALGVVDFPAMADGREIYLCWQFGEPRVMYWHEYDAGDTGRQSIDTLPSGVAIAAQA